MTTLYRGVVEKRILYPKSIIIDAKNLDAIDFNNMIYCEISDVGAMGHEGGILLYVLEHDNKLTTYETNVFTDEDAYIATSRVLGQYLELFTYYYGTFGNHIYIKKDANLEIDEKYKCFWYHSNTAKLRIDSSVSGVFLAVASEMSK